MSRLERHILIRLAALPMQSSKPPPREVRYSIDSVQTMGSGTNGSLGASKSGVPRLSSC